MSNLYPKSQGSLTQIYSNCVLEKTNKYLYTQPEITLFKAVYKRHTLFSIESIENSPYGQPGFGNKIKFILSRNADVVNKMYLEVTLPYNNYDDLIDEEKTYWTNRIGFNLIKNVSIEIGGQQIDKLYGLYMHIWSELTHNVDKKGLLDKMVGTKGIDGKSNGLCCDKPHKLTIPLFFPCHQYIENSIPLVGLQYHEVSINIKFNELENCIQKGILPPNRLDDVKLWVDYIYLDTEERQEIATNEGQYLNNYTSTIIHKNMTSNELVKVDLSHCCKELFWVLRKKKPEGDKFTDFTCVDKNKLKSLIKNVQMYKNNSIVFSSGSKLNDYFNYYLPYRRHTGKPDLGINCYPFALYPEKFEPSGHLNFSMIDNFQIEIEKNNNDECDLFIFGRVIDHLRVMSGMGGRAFMG